MRRVDKALPLVIFSDLDGTLLDHVSYDFEPARPLLERLARSGVALVVATSKTAAEVAPIRSALGFAHCPAIVENGAGILEPGANAMPDGAVRDALRQKVAALPAGLGRRFTGFGDWGPAEIARRTGLDPDAAARAAERQFTEPGVFRGDAAQLEAFLDQLRAVGISAQRGGRFLTLSFGADKAARVAEVVRRYGAPRTVALGDGENDIAMIEAADIGIVVPNPAHPPLPALAGEADGRVIRAPAPGPRGWRRALEAVLAEMPGVGH